MEKVFYICSYGGCGSKMLTSALRRYGTVYHVHSRSPPGKLQYITHEQFNGVEVPPELLKNYYVIYIYKNPVKAILSRFTGKPGYYNKRHLRHVGCNPHITVDAVISQSKDLYQLQQFYDNYTKPAPRNYDVYCIKYESLFERQNDISAVFDIGPLKLVKRESDHSDLESKHMELYAIYDDLIQQMAKNDFIFVQKGTPPSTPLVLSKLAFS
jgi:hypothetical protein